MNLAVSLGAEPWRLVLAALFVGGGLFFFAVGVLGLMRLPDAFSRMHAAAKADTLGAGLILAGLITLFGLGRISAQLLLIVIFIAISTPVATHLIAQALYTAERDRDTDR